jgi:hypothetical protein
MIGQNTIVYHELYGKGIVLDVKYRRGDSLLFCSFKKGKFGFITEKQLIEGHGQITLKPVSPNTRKKDMSLEEALKGLMSGGDGYSPMD